MKHQYIVWGYPLFVPPTQAEVEQLSEPCPLKHCQTLARDLSLYLTTIVRDDRSWLDDQAFIDAIAAADEEWAAYPHSVKLLRTIRTFRRGATADSLGQCNSSRPVGQAIAIPNSRTQRRMPNEQAH